ncbi:type I-E CRISPR-associated protein Cse2/CasB [Streptomyces daliensis]|uniref:Type I-E CRISPR-associated protein Cse2/CasB n=1 Tax=Streptomyces daliensis TaxID=299421 RepID=A0A8T4J3Q8_9ACTN|nr:type I-E CRISPR-associated protein Cse2/CasB [Streptomyces daliensis]
MFDLESAIVARDATAARDLSALYRHAEDFVTRVHTLCEDPGRRAALRSGLGRPLDDCPRMHAVIAQFVPSRFGEATERAYYAVASMIASLPPSARRTAKEGKQQPATTARNLGQCLAESKVRGTAAEARLSLLCRQSLPGLHRHLPPTVRLLADGPDTVDFAQLLVDLTRWERNRDRTARAWLQTYYRTSLREERKEAADADAKQAAADDGESPQGDGPAQSPPTD